MLQTATGNFITSESLGSYPGDPWYDDNLVFGYNSTNSKHQTIYLTFTTPSFIGDSKEISFCIQGQFGMTSVKFRYALCTSNTNRDLYKNSGGKSVSDPYQLTSGITNLTSKGTGYTTGVDKFTLTLSEVTLKPNTKYYLFFWLTEDYHGYIGKNGEFIIRRLATINHLPYCTYTLTYNDVSVFIDNDSGFGQYYCYIDTESITSTYSCEILGQRSFEATKTGAGVFDSLKLFSDYSTTNNACWGNSYVDSNTVAHYLYQLKFKTPENVGDISKLIIGIKTYVCNYDDGYPGTGYTLSSSDEYYEGYLMYSNGYTVDPSAIIYGEFEENTSSGGISNIVINNIKLSPSTIYYLNIYGGGSEHYYNGPTTYISPVSEHTVAAIGSDSIVYEYELYAPYIDTGATWELL